MKLYSLSLLLASVLLGQDNARDLLNKGIQAFKQAKYADAADLFRRAANASPNEVTPHLYLGMAHLSQYIPGSPAAENQTHASLAESEFRQVLNLDSKNKQALLSLGSLSLNQKKLDDAKQWYEAVLGADPNEKVAHYTLGVIAWSKSFPVRMDARKKLAMKPEDPGPLPPSVRFDVANKNWAVIKDGIANLQKAIDLDPQYDDAMAYLNLMYRERADVQDTVDAYRADVQKADEWVQQTLQVKRAKTSPGNYSATQPPPPPPPPPAASSTTLPPDRIRVGGNVQQANLIQQTRPIYPPLAKQARIQGTVRFDTVIGKDGHVIWLQVVNGHPLLIPPAQESVRQWVYRPTLLNGLPVEVQTVIDVNFTLVEP